MSIIKRTPMAISGIALSLAALGNLLLPYGEWVRYLCGALSAAILILFILKLIFDFAHARDELKNPVVLSVMPTVTMAIMLLCVYLKPFIGTAATVLWYAAGVAQILIMLLFVKRFVLGFNLKNVFPSWFVTGVGLVTLSVTSPAMDARVLGQIVFYVGCALYLIILVTVLYRMIKAGPIPEPVRPTIAIFTAPVSLCVAGYLSAFQTPNAPLVYSMLALAVISYVYVAFNIGLLLNPKFYPTYAAFTFPYVISAAAFKSADAFLVKNGYRFFSFVSELSKWIAVAVVAYVLIRYVMFMAAKPKRGQS